MKLRIFVIDDEECIRDTFTWHLESLGHEVIAISEPSHCHVYMGECCKREYACSDVMIIDYNMPNMTGIQLLDSMEKRGCKSASRYKMLLTGDASQIDQEKAIQHDFIVRQKPLSLSELEAWINKLMKEIPKNRTLSELNSLQLG